MKTYLLGKARFTKYQGPEHTPDGETIYQWRHDTGKLYRAAFLTENELLEMGAVPDEEEKKCEHDYKQYPKGVFVCRKCNWCEVCNPTPTIESIEMPENTLIIMGGLSIEVLNWMKQVTDAINHLNQKDTNHD